jgi:hypothetical protein
MQPGRWSHLQNLTRFFLVARHVIPWKAQLSAARSDHHVAFHAAEGSIKELVSASVIAAES